MEEGKRFRNEGGDITKKKMIQAKTRFEESTDLEKKRGFGGRPKGENAVETKERQGVPEEKKICGDRL